jgi:pimeloyl-ACP methyl ester carboxylesterase
MKNRKRTAAVAALVLGAALVGVLGVEGVARFNLRHEQAARSYLGDQLYTEIRGQGTPMVFLAGLEGSTEFWQNRFEPLTRDHRLIFVDALGFGRSPWPDVRYTLEDHLGALRRTLVAKGATRDVTIVAHSLGTILATYYAALYPSEVERLVLLGVPVFDSASEAKRRIREMSSIAALFSLHRWLAREACLTMGAFRPLLRKVLPSLVPDLPPGVASDSVLHSWPAIDGTLRNVLFTRPVGIPLQEIGPKVTFIHGSADAVTPLPRIERLARAIGARVVVTGNDHRRYISDSYQQVLQVLATSPRSGSDASGEILRNRRAIQEIMLEVRNEPGGKPSFPLCGGPEDMNHDDQEIDPRMGQCGRRGHRLRIRPPSLAPALGRHG